MKNTSRFHHKIYWSLGVCFFVFAALVLPPALVQNRNFKAEAQQVMMGNQGNSYGTASAPTALMNQSKLWFNDGIWWGSLYNPASDQFEIFRYDGTAHTWITTNTLIDPRRVSRADCLWNGQYLYVVSAARIDTTITNNKIWFTRYQYDSTGKQYVVDPNFPIQIASQYSNGIVLDQDTTGIFWVTYTAPDGSGGSSVYVSHSLNADGTQWVTPYILPVPGTTNLLLEEISSLVANNGQIGLMWSNQNQDAMYYAIHKNGDPDTQWQSFAPIQGTLFADNLINMKSMQASSDGRIFAAVKTSLNKNNSDPNAPLLVLLQINPDGTWIQRTFGTVSDKHTRPMLLIDDENRILYMFATSYCCGNGKIYFKAIKLDDPYARFMPGVGNPFLDFGDNSYVNNVTSTKQTVDNNSGILILAEDSITGNYVFNTIDLSSFTPPLAPSLKIMLPLIVH